MKALYRGDGNQMRQSSDKDKADAKRTQGSDKKERKKEKRQRKLLRSWQASFLFQF